MSPRALTATALAVLLAPLALWADDVRPAEDATVEDLSEFQGEWQVVAMQKDGQAVPEHRWKELRWLFQDGKVIQYAGAMKCRQGSLHPDRTKDPPELIVSYSVGRAACYAFRIRGDRLEVAQSDSGGPPTGFTPDLGFATLFVLRRVRK